MTPTGTCSTCGTQLFAESAAGLCPKCLGTLGFDATESFLADNEQPLSGSLRLGDYELIEEIARGGMGVVYKARQLSLNRIVAVKVVLRSPFSSAEVLRRFQVEAAVVASLQHPNIVAIYEIGEHGNDHFLSMEYIEGKSFADLVREDPLPARRAAGYLKCIAEGVHHAHQRGVLHRDLKPSNVLLDAFDLPRITDFGVAKLLNSNADLTATGQVIGSPNYMCPEQAGGKAVEVGPQSDVYSLGAILYHLLTGRAPFQGETIQEVLLQVQSVEPVSPRRLNPSVPADLETICLKCLQKDPTHRYASARELGEDLDRFLAAEPIHARPANWVGRALRWCRRKPALAASMGLAGVFLLVILIGSPIALVRIERARRAASSAEQATKQQLFTSLVELARATVLSGEMGHRVRALEALGRAAALSNTVELRREVFAAVALPDLRFDRELAWSENYTLRKLDPSFERIALCRNRGPVEIRSTSDGRILATLPASSNLPVFDNTEWNVDGRLLAVKRDRNEGGDRADWEVWNVAQEKQKLLLKDIPLRAFDFVALSQQIVVGRPTKHLPDGRVSGQVEVWDLDHQVELRRFELPAGAYLLRASPEGGRVAAAFWVSNRQHVAVVNLTNGLIQTFATFDSMPRNLTWHPDGNSLVVPTGDGVLYVLDATTGETRALGQHKSAAITAHFSRDGKYMFSGGWDNELICWDWLARRRAFRINLNTFSMQLSSDESECALLTPSGVLLHKFERPTAVREFGEVLGERLWHATFSPDGRWLAATAGKRLGLWDLQNNGPAVFADEGFDGEPSFSPDSTELFVSRGNQEDHWAWRWRILPATNSDAAPSIQKLPLPVPPEFLSLSTHSNRVAITTTKGSRVFASNQSESASDHWTPTSPGVNHISPDGAWLGIFKPFTSALFVYRLPGLELVTNLVQGDVIYDFVFSPQGNEVAVASRAGLGFWKTGTWERTRLITNYFHLLYAADGQALWLLKDLRNAGLFDARSLQPLLLLPADMLPLATSPDGSHLAVSVAARRLQVWDLAALHRELRDLSLDWQEEAAKVPYPSH